MVGIYKITSPLGNVYIGQSWDIEYRFQLYNRPSYKNGQLKLENSFSKHGVENHTFEIVHELPVDVEQCILDTYEILYISQYRDCGVEMLNLKEGGSYGKHSEESKKKMSEKQKGKKLSEDTKRKMSRAKKGKKLSEETKKRRGIGQKGINIGKDNPFYGKSHSEETKQKMSNSLNGNKHCLGRKHSEESKKKMSESHTGLKYSKTINSLT